MMGEVYLAERGLTEETIRTHGIEIDELLSAKTIKDRLGRGLSNKGVNEIIWFPIFDSQQNLKSWIARILPTIAGLGKFLCPVGSTGMPFIPRTVYGLSHGKPVIITEGPVKALACLQAGCDAIGINGVWGAGVKNAKDVYTISADLHGTLDWRGRKVYLAFDADCAVNPDVRQACIRLFFILSSCGAEIFQLTDWSLSEGKGIDDYLLGQFRSNGQCKPQDVLGRLLTAAKPFIDSLESTPLDLALVCSELGKVYIPELLREQFCKPLATRLGVKVDQLRRIGANTNKAADFVDPDPWPLPVNGDALLAELTAITQKHVVTDDHCRIAIALWSVLAFLVDLVDAMPILAVVSPEKRCGKSRLLSLLLRLVRRPIIGVSLTAATIYRAIEKWHPTLLIDEADGMLRDNRGHDNLELRNVINSSHLRDHAFTLRCVGENHDPRRFSTWAPKAIALIGKMPDSMMDRAIPIPMKRKTKAETVARIQDSSPQVFAELRSKIVRFVQDYGEKIATHKPVLPAGLNDRAEDCWSPLLAIADIAGGNWPDLARKAALALSSDADNDADTFRTAILRAVKKAFENANENTPSGFLSTADICAELNSDDEAPWADFRNKMTKELLARNLRPFKVKSEQVTVGGQRQRGFFWKKLEPVFNRYL